MDKKGVAKKKGPPAYSKLFPQLVSWIISPEKIITSEYCFAMLFHLC